MPFIRAAVKEEDSEMISKIYKNHIKNSKFDDFIKKNLNFFLKRKYLTKAFWQWYNFLDEASYWDEAKVMDFQLDRLKELVNYAYNNTDYFFNLFNELAINPKSIQSFDDFKNLPFSDRHLFMKEKKRLLSRSIDLSKCHYVRTSGTTGNPLVFYKPSICFTYELATIYHFWKRIGFSPFEKRFVLNGDILPDKKPWIYATGNYIRFSPNKMNKERVNLYLKLMNNYGAKYLHGYPSAISLMAKVIKENNLTLSLKLKGVFLGTEPIYQWQRDVISNVFGCRVFSHYGNTEAVALAGECEESSFYHFSSLFSYVELDDQTNEIIGTSFWNDANPFIRHRTKDIAKPLTNVKQCSCGRNGLLIETVEGRQGDYLISLQDEYIFPQAVSWITYGTETVKESQIIQHKDYSIVFRYTPYNFALRDDLNKDLKHIKNRLLDMMGGPVKIDFEEEEFIEKTARGKVRWIQSEISEGLIETGLP